MTTIRWALLLAPAVLVAACSGGSHSATKTPSVTPTASPSVSSTLPSASPTTTPSAIATTPTSTPASSPATQIIPLSPVDSSGKLKPGYTVVSTETGTHCVAGSDTGATAYRCFSANGGVYDPCWIDTDDTTRHTVACVPQPMTMKVYRLRVAQFVGTLNASNRLAPLELQLSSGERCGALQGAHDVFNGRVIDFACDHRAVLRPLHTETSLWTAETVTDEPGTTARYAAGPTMSVTTAWVAVPSLSGATS